MKTMFRRLTRATVAVMLCGLCAFCVQENQDSLAFAMSEEDRALDGLLNPLVIGGGGGGSGSSELPDITVRPANPAGDDDKDLLSNGLEDDLIRKFAPTYYLHSKEHAKMAGVHWVLQHSQRMIFLKTIGVGRFPFPLPGKPTIHNLGDYRFTDPFGNKYRADRWNDIKKGAFYIEWPHAFLRFGYMPSSRCYALARVSSTPGVDYEVQYWWFYPYNPGRTILNVGKHPGDWEHVVVNIRKNKTLHSVQFYSHGNPKTYYPGSLKLDHTGRRPTVYSAFESHASYPKAGTHFYGGPVYDRTNHGERVDCSKRFVNIGNRSHPSSGNAWIKYYNKWGGKKGIGSPSDTKWGRRKWESEGGISMPSSTSFQYNRNPKRIRVSVSSLATKTMDFRITSARMTGVSAGSIRLVGTRSAEISLQNRHNAGQQTARVTLTYSAGGLSFTRTKNMRVTYSKDNPGGGGPIDQECLFLDGPCRL